MTNYNFFGNIRPSFSRINSEGVIEMGTVKIKVSEIAEAIGVTQKILTSRPQGKLAREELLLQCEKLMSGDYLDLDFNSIHLCDVSFIDEIIVKVQIILKGRECALFITNVAPGIKENLEAILALREIKGERNQILEFKDNRFAYVGTLEPNLNQAFNLLSQKVHLTARELAELLDIQINNASNRLKKLSDSGLVLRKEYIDSVGKQHFYSLPTR